MHDHDARRTTHDAPNAQMKPRHIRRYCRVAGDSLRLMETAMNSLSLWTRADNHILKVPRTIADLEEMENVTSHHISEAIQYRNPLFLQVLTVSELSCGKSFLLNIG